MKRAIFSSLVLGLCFLSVTGAAQDAGLYTASQAQQGAALFGKQCAACHGADLGGGAGPALKGVDFNSLAAGQHMTVASLLDVMSRSMPMTAPGSLKPEDYAALTAFLLQQSGLPAGSVTLAASNTGLDKIALGANGAAPATAAAGARMASSGVYTQAQMAQGKSFYDDNCNQCHGAELEGAEDAPPLAGKAFISKWGGLPLGTLHAFIDKNMPPGNGGALGPTSESAVLAYVLSKNYFPPGAAPLPSDPAGLNAIAIK